MIAVAKASGGLPEIGFRYPEALAKQKPKDQVTRFSASDHGRFLRVE
ncbi:MAG: hypothetical protein V2G45_06150 [bacterium JZ-2024 1]